MAGLWWNAVPGLCGDSECMAWCGGEHILEIIGSTFWIFREGKYSLTIPHHFIVFLTDSQSKRSLQTFQILKTEDDWGQNIFKPFQCMNIFFTVVGQFSSNVWNVCKSGSTLWLWDSIAVTLRNKGLLPLYPQQQTTEKNQYCWNQYNTEYRHFVSGNSQASQPASRLCRLKCLTCYWACFSVSILQQPLGGNMMRGLDREGSKVWAWPL